jgi:hypothetical protein
MHRATHLELYLKIGVAYVPDPWAQRAFLSSHGPPQSLKFTALTRNLGQL